MKEAEKILRVDHNLTWLPKPHEAHLVLSSQLPAQELVVTALALVFAGDRLLLTNLTERGWDIPGGHLEPGEHPEEAVRREITEETGATVGALQLLGYQRLRLLGPKAIGYRYPHPENYQVFYHGQVESLNDFTATEEAQGRALFSPQEARQTGWVQRHSELYEAALALALR